jgi:hypothetical protein
VATKSTAQNSEGQQSPEWIDGMTYEANKHIEKGKARVHKLRGYRAQTEAAKLWADKQEVKVQRQGVQLKTERTNLEIDKERDGIADTNLKGTQAESVLNKVGWAQKLTKKAYSVGVKPGTLGNNALPPSSAEVVNLVDLVRQKDTVKEKR